MASTRAGHATTRSPRYALGPGADLPIARIVAVLLILLPVGALFVASNLARSGPSPEAQEIASFNPRTIFADNTPHFLPTPVAALPAEANAGGVGAILRADPPRGRQVAALRDGVVLQVLDHQQLPDGSEWLHVRTSEGAEGWVFSRLVAPAD